MDLRRLRRMARKQGWVIRETGSGHLLWIAPSGARVICPSTPSDHRSMPNTVADLRRAGLDLPRKAPRKKSA